MNGLKTVPSPFGPKATMDQFEGVIRDQGMTVFARIDHAANAEKVGLSLRPTELLIFGNARGGTPLMLVNQTIGLDLPLKALVWQDCMGQTWLTYNEPFWLASRHGLVDMASPLATAMSVALAALQRLTTEVA